jgi:transketolase N-terminal domain/subunit
MGDGESMEGSVWEALHFAGFYKLDNLCAIIDVNRSHKVTYGNLFVKKEFRKRK